MLRKDVSFRLNLWQGLYPKFLLLNQERGEEEAIKIEKIYGLV